jgi:hypothetical protein
MSSPLPNTIIKAVGHQFLRGHQAEARRLLAEYECGDAALRERVLACAVSLAGRDIARLTHFLECAREDGRNLILWHEHAEESRRCFFKSEVQDYRDR